MIGGRVRASTALGSLYRVFYQCAECTRSLWYRLSLVGGSAPSRTRPPGPPICQVVAGGRVSVFSRLVVLGLPLAVRVRQRPSDGRRTVSLDRVRAGCLARS